MEAIDSANQYDVALSFAGEDRAFAEQLATELGSRGVKVFYDQHEKASLWGKDLYQFLSDLYQNRAQYCVIFISQHYAAKLWTNHELKAAQARAFREQREYILPIRLDATEIIGILPGVAYLSWPPESAPTIADALAAKLGRRIVDRRTEDQTSESGTHDAKSKAHELPQSLPRSVGLTSPETPRLGANVPEGRRAPFPWARWQTIHTWFSRLLVDFQEGFQEGVVSTRRRRVTSPGAEIANQPSSGFTARTLMVVLVGGATWTLTNHNTRALWRSIRRDNLFWGLGGLGDVIPWLLGGAISTLVLFVPFLIRSLKATDPGRRAKLLITACGGKICGSLAGLFIAKVALGFISIEAPLISSIGACLGDIGGGFAVLWMAAPSGAGLTIVFWLAIIAFGSIGVPVASAVAAVKSSSLVASWAAHSGHVNSLIVRLAGDDIVSAGEDGALKQWKLPSGRQLSTIFKGSDLNIAEALSVSSELSAVLVSRIEKRNFLSSSVNYELDVINFAGKKLSALPIGKREYQIFGVDPFPHTVWCERIQSFFVLSQIGVEVWSMDSRTKNYLIPVPMHLDSFKDISSMKGNPQSCMLFLSADTDQIITLNGLNGQQGPRISIAKENGDQEFALKAVDPRGRWLAVVIQNQANERRLEIVDTQGELNPKVQSGRLSRVLALNVLAFSPDGKILAGGSIDGHVDLWKTDSGALIERLKIPFFFQSRIESITFSSAGDFVVTGGEDGEIAVWRVPVQATRAMHDR